MVRNNMYKLPGPPWPHLLPWVSEKLSRSNQMPLPNLNRQCTVRARSTGNQCLNPAAFGCKSCRVHGARRKETVKAGKDHPQYKHGEKTQEAIQRYRTTMAELHNLEQFGQKSGLLKGPRTSGRKPKTSQFESTINQ
jgi:hypothetical protein